MYISYISRCSSLCISTVASEPAVSWGRSGHGLGAGRSANTMI